MFDVADGKSGDRWGSEERRKGRESSGSLGLRKPTVWFLWACLDEPLLGKACHGPALLDRRLGGGGGRNFEGSAGEGGFDVGKGRGDGEEEDQCGA